MTIAFIQAEDSVHWTEGGFLHNLIASALNFPLDTFELYRATDNQLPDDLSKLEGVVISGSHHNVTDDLDWMGGLLKFIRRCAKQPSLRVVGICFGCQAVAAALGGRADYNPNGQFRYAVERVEIVDAAIWKSLFAASEMPPSRLLLLEAHGQQVAERPVESTLLAESPGSPSELFLAGEHRNILCCQSHPEFDAAHFVDKVTPEILEERLVTEEQAKSADLSFQAERLDSHILRRLFHAWLRGDVPLPLSV